MSIIGEASKTSYFYKRFKNDNPDWHLLYKFKCTSTELQLNNYLRKHNKLTNPIAIISKAQTSGFGQHQRDWQSPKGGVWLSAAYPINSSGFFSKIFSLSVACKLCEIFANDSIRVELKWPNDILYESKKLIGFLPGVVTRGNKVLYVRVGIGLNLNNKTPQEGVSLSQVLGKKGLSEHYWTSRILYAISEAIKFNYQKEKVILEANKLINKKYLPSGYSGDHEIKDIDCDGNLRLILNNQIKVISI